MRGGHSARRANLEAEDIMKKRGTLPAVCAAVLLLAGRPALADTTGSAADAKAMLERAVAAVTADEAKALASFNHGDAGFKDRDLYVFCARVDGKVDAHIDAKQVGRNIKDLYDVDGVAFGQEMMAVARPGSIVAVSYMWPKPDSRTPAPKVTFVTRVADQMCGVGYYK
jgi:signal transduction histidine kinase